MSNIGFVGLGNMGSPMAANLVRAGHDVRGFDLEPAALARALQAGIRVSSSAADAVIDADVVITMLPSAAHLLDLYRSQLVGSAPPCTLFIDCSTTDVSGARTAHSIARQAGMVALDAPVSGGVRGATNATLTFMVGGDAEALRRAEPILSAMGTRIVHCGEAGTGQAAKICNNMILGVSMIAVCEAFLLGEALGISAQALFEVLSTSSGQCWSVTSYCPVPELVPSSPANSGYASGFATSLMLKDLKLARDAADKTGTAATLGRKAAEIYSAFESSGFGSTDFSGVINYIRSERKRVNESTAAPFETILVEKRGRVALIILNRPQVLNALNQQCMREVTSALNTLDRDPDIGCVVLTGSEKAFAAGADIKEMRSLSFMDAYSSNWLSGWDAVGSIRKPIIAAVAGFALGGGCELAMACDIILAADTAKFGQPEIKLGTIPGMGGSQRLTRAIGKSKAMEMCLTGRMMGAAEAEIAGLVARVVPAADLIADAIATAETIAGMSLPIAMMVKEVVRRSDELSLAEGLQFERCLFHQTFATQDQTEGMTAFMEKRPARFSHS